VVGVNLRADTQAVVEKAATFMEALPYIKRYRGQTVVVKTGGRAMEERGALHSLVSDVLMLHLVGMRPVIVHGGGVQISELMKRFDQEPRFVEGYRVTGAEELETVRMALQRANKEIVSLLNSHGDHAVGVSGEDANLIRAERMTSDTGVDLGFVGKVEHVEPRVLEGLIQGDFIPVVAPIGVDSGGQALNVNADHAAAAVASALKAAKLVFLTDVEGLYDDFGDHGSLLSRVTVAELDELLGSGKLSEGMLPKVRGCVEALQAGVERAHILDGRVQHAVLLEIFTDTGIGTMVEPT
jgi:acetylglutamate kinase